MMAGRPTGFVGNVPIIFIFNFYRLTSYNINLINTISDIVIDYNYYSQIQNFKIKKGSPNRSRVYTVFSRRHVATAAADRQLVYEYMN